MSTKTVDMREAQQHFSELLALVLEGNEIIIEENGAPLVRVAPIMAPGKDRVAGLRQGAIWTSDDFDAPLPEAFWAAT